MFFCQFWTPAIRQLMPRTIISIFTPACEAAISFFDQVFVCQRVDLDADIGRHSGFRQFRLLVDHICQLVLQALRCYQQMLGVFHSLSQTECMEYPIGFQTDVVVGGHQGIVCVNGRGLFVIVASTHLCDIWKFPCPLF